jgi:peroxiredoxin-like protein
VHELPHHYTVSAKARAEGEVSLESQGLEPIASAPPAEFGGPGNRWSPETLLVAAVADCFILSFRGIARASRLAWIDLDCTVEGVLERSEGSTRFTRFLVRATLELPADVDQARADRLLDKAKNSCLITNSLNGEVLLEKIVQRAD